MLCSPAHQPWRRCERGPGLGSANRLQRSLSRFDPRTLWLRGGATARTWTGKVFTQMLFFAATLAKGESQPLLSGTFFMMHILQILSGRGRRGGAVFLGASVLGLVLDNMAV